MASVVVAVADAWMRKAARAREVAVEVGTFVENEPSAQLRVCRSVRTARLRTGSAMNVNNSNFVLLWNAEDNGGGQNCGIEVQR